MKFSQKENLKILSNAPLIAMTFSFLLQWKITIIIIIIINIYVDMYGNV